MGYVIGDNVVGINTWAKLRGAVIQNSPPSRYDGNEVYPDTGIAFKSEQGKGLLKRGLTSSLAIADLTMRIDDTDFYLAGINFDDRYESVLIGEDVVNDSAEAYAIVNDAFDPPDYQALTPSPSTYTIVDIGLFDPIT
jgi:hypothetical protein